MRELEAIDIEDPSSLERYLRVTGRVTGTETLQIRILAGGVSNKTVLVCREDGEAWVLKQALPKLRTKVDWFSDPARIRREAVGLKVLSELAPPGAIPALVFEDADQFLLAMQAVPQPHENWKNMLIGGSVNPDHVRQFGALIGQIQSRASQRAIELAPLFDDRTFFESLRIEPYYAYTAQQVTEATQFYEELIDETRATRYTLVHGDYSPKNVLVYHDRLVLLDHEVIHWGDGTFDVGFGLSHLLSKAHHCIDGRAQFKESAVCFWTAYQEQMVSNSALPSSGSQIEQRSVRHALGCLLARVAGRSTLEYLDPLEREVQRNVVVALMHDPPGTVFELAARFIEGIESH